MNIHWHETLDFIGYMLQWHTAISKCLSREASDTRIYLTLSYDFSYSKFYSLQSVLLILSLWVHIKKNYTRFHSPQEELSNQEKWQMHPPRLNLVLKVEVLHTNTAHTALMLAMEMAVTRATGHLQWFKLILQHKNTFGCKYIQIFTPP